MNEAKKKKARYNAHQCTFHNKKRVHNSACKDKPPPVDCRTDVPRAEKRMSAMYRADKRMVLSRKKTPRDPLLRPERNCDKLIYSVRDIRCTCAAVHFPIEKQGHACPCRNAALDLG